MRAHPAAPTKTAPTVAARRVGAICRAGISAHSAGHSCGSVVVPAPVLRVEGGRGHRRQLINTRIPLASPGERPLASGVPNPLPSLRSPRLLAASQVFHAVAGGGTPRLAAGAAWSHTASAASARLGAAPPPQQRRTPSRGDALARGAGEAGRGRRAGGARLTGSGDCLGSRPGASGPEFLAPGSLLTGACAKAREPAKIPRQRRRSTARREWGSRARGSDRQRNDVHDFGRQILLFGPAAPAGPGCAGLVFSSSQQLVLSFREFRMPDSDYRWGNSAFARARFEYAFPTHTNGPTTCSS
jgi:hypothetical protein